MIQFHMNCKYIRQMTQKPQLNLNMKIKNLIKSWLECQTEVFKIICPQIAVSF